MSRKFSNHLAVAVATCVTAAVALAAGGYSYLDYEGLDPSQVSYKISATTSGPQQSWLPGTKQNVTLRIYGSKSKAVVERQLNGPFAAGESQNFPEIYDANVGYPCSITLKTDGPDGWLAESVEVEYFNRNQRITRATFSQNEKGLGWIDGQGCGQEIGTNLAPSGTASQSSNYRNDAYLAGTAIDGKTDGGFMHTKNASREWWQVQLAERSLISRIMIWNRTDCCKDRLTNFTVSILANEDKKDAQGNVKTESVVVWNLALFPDPRGYPDPSFYVDAPEGTMGDIVKVQMNGANYLHMAEVQVFGTRKTDLVGACREPDHRFFADDTVEACDELQRARNAPANPSTVTAASTPPAATLQTIVPSPNDQAGLVRINATGFVQNAAAQLATLTITFSVKDTSQIWQELSVDTGYVENGLSAEVSKIVAIKSAVEPLSFANLTVPYGAFQNAAFQTLQSRREPYEMRVVGVLNVGGVELDRSQASFRITIR